MRRLLLGLAVALGADPRGEDLLAAAALDELWSEKNWGADAELTARLTRLRGELAAVEAWFIALSIGNGVGGVAMEGGRS